jgi:hypothetical protein
MSGSRPERFISRSLNALVLIALSGCAYSFSSGLPGHIRTVAVPLFANETSEFGIAEEITDQLVAALVRDGTLRVVADEADASSVLWGTVRVYSEKPQSFDRNENVQSFIIQITVDVRFHDRVRDEPLWEASLLTGSAVYPNTGPDDRATGLEEAIDQVVQEVLAGMVAGW